ncbi:MAG: FkbM family methyltransferase [Gammaproteobacteria bacterium]
MIDSISRFVCELFKIYRTADRSTFCKYLVAIFTSLPEIIISQSLSPADKKMVGRLCSFHPFQKNITLDGLYFDLAREIYCQKCYFLFPEYQITPSDCVVDLGSNAGVFTVLAALHANRVVAVEAQSRFIGEMENNLRENRVLDKVKIEFGLIGYGSGVFSDEKKLKSSSHYTLPPPLLSFNEVIKRHQIEQIDLLKVDIEGSEFDLFVNDPTWINKVNKIAMEVHQDFGDLNTIVEILLKYGFKTMLANKNGNNVTVLRDPIGYLFANKN